MHIDRYQFPYNREGDIPYKEPNKKALAELREKAGLEHHRAFQVGERVAVIDKKNLRCGVIGVVTALGGESVTVKVGEPGPQIVFAPHQLARFA